MTLPKGACVRCRRLPGSHPCAACLEWIGEFGRCGAVTMVTGMPCNRRTPKGERCSAHLHTGPRTCPGCGTQFPARWPKHTYCSRSCSARTAAPTRAKRWERSCDRCGTTYWTQTPVQSRYCSRLCGARSRLLNTDYTSTRVCPTCGESFRPNQTRGNPPTYCSRRCQGRAAARIKRDLPVADSAYRCLWCDGPLSSPAQRLCSPLCRRRQKHLRAVAYRYGITPERWREMWRAQDGACAICSVVPGGVEAWDVLHVDHDHATGKVRGLLCTYCNTAIGYLRENSEVAQAVSAYLLHHVEEAS